MLNSKIFKTLITYYDRCILNGQVLLNITRIKIFLTLYDASAKL